MVSCFKKFIPFSLLVLVISCGQDGKAPGLTSGGGGILGLRIFISDTTDGNIGGVAGADNLCNSSAASRGLSGTYKAIITASTRIACTTANCSGGVGEHVDWVLQPNTAYYREDGSTLIGTTTANGVFSYPITNSVSTVGASYWTGMRQDWTNVANDDCNDWTGGGTGRGGYSTLTDSRAFGGDGYNGGCLNPDTVACAEQ